jgi:hypothetical protein
MLLSKFCYRNTTALASDGIYVHQVHMLTIRAERALLSGMVIDRDHHALGAVGDRHDREQRPCAPAAKS